MSEQKRSFEEAFKRKNLDRVEINDYHTECTVFKVLKSDHGDNFYVKTSQNFIYSFGEEVIKETSTSATLFDSEKRITRSEMIKLFSSLSVNDIWSAVYYKRETDKNWQEELVAKIQKMEKNAAVKYVKNDFYIFGRIIRKLKGQKISMTSDNNYYLVRDLDIYFDCLDDSSQIATAEKKSIRNLDVNTLQSLIFNGVKYILK